MRKTSDKVEKKCLFIITIRKTKTHLYLTGLHMAVVSDGTTGCRPW
jgi:hypothetical protein